MPFCVVWGDFTGKSESLDPFFSLCENFPFLGQPTSFLTLAAYVCGEQGGSACRLHIMNSQERRSDGKHPFVSWESLSKPGVHPFVITWTNAAWHISIGGVLPTQGEEHNWEMCGIHRAITEPINEVYTKASRELMKSKDFGIYVEQLDSLIRVPMRVPSRPFTSLTSSLVRASTRSQQQIPSSSS